MNRHRLRHLFRLKSHEIRLVVPNLVEPSSLESSVTARIIGWSSVAIGVAALGVFVGREIRTRYKFKRRTPYDYYAHSAERVPRGDYGIGI